MSGKEGKGRLEEYEERLVEVGRIEEGKGVLVSWDVGEGVDGVVGMVGGRGMRVWGMMEKMVGEEVRVYEEELEGWGKL